MAVIKFIGIICFTWLFVVGAAPVQFVKEFIGISNDSKPKDTIRQLLQKLVNCASCMGFWFGIIFYKDIWFACIISVCSEVFCRILNRFLTNFF